MINYFTPLTLSILIHLGIIFSFSNIFNVNFDQFNIESSKPIAAYIIFEEKKTIPIKKNSAEQYNKSRTGFKHKD